MASLQKKGNGWYCQFVHHGKRHTFAVGAVTEAEARSKAAQVEYLLMRLEQRLVELPPGVGIVEFVRRDGKASPVGGLAAMTAERVTLGSLRDLYLETHGNGSLEERTLDGIRLHFRHLVAALGEAFPIGDLALSDLQAYIDRRAKAKGLRGPLSPATIRKEIVTLRTTWNWGLRMELVDGRFPSGGLRYPKRDAKPPFQTRAEIERQLAGIAARDQAELWDALYLRLPEIEELLAHVRDQAGHAWIHPLIATAAHTGARRSELIRMRLSDVDFEAGILTVREKKRSHSERTTRRVPLSSSLASVLREWIAVHPGGPWLFCQAGEVKRSKNRSRTTGHLARPTREKTLAGRMKTVRNREGAGIMPLSKDEAHDHFKKRTLADSPWSVVRGYHTLRHSFISACASRGVDQRLIQEWVGHLTAEVHKRYSHLYPSVQIEAIRGVFG